MRWKSVLALAAGFCAAMSLSAQTKISGTLQCGKPDPVHSIEVGDAGKSVMNLVKVSCTWSKGFEMGGVAAKDGTSVAATEMQGAKSKEHGIHVGTMANGDTYDVHFQGTGAWKADHSGTVTGTWSFDGGTGKLKGLTGKGTYKTTNNADGTGTAMVEGEYKLP